MTLEGNIILRTKLVRKLFELVLTDKNVYFCQKVSKYGHNNNFVEDKYIPIQRIQDIDLINEGIKILSLRITTIYINESYYLPCPPPPPE